MNGKAILRGAGAVAAVVLVVILLKAVRLSPTDVFVRQDNFHFDTPFGGMNLGDQSSLFHPLLLMHILSVPALWHLCRRAGYSSWFSLAALIPLANVLLLYFLAFAEWPNQPRDERPLGPAGEVKPSGPSNDIRV
jgi:hypothetical protein